MASAVCNFARLVNQQSMWAEDKAKPNTHSVDPLPKIESEDPLKEHDSPEEDLAVPVNIKSTKQEEEAKEEAKPQSSAC